MVKKMAKRAVSPVLATLMMVAVAVAMSVIIFTWSQSFLSQTSEAASGQQAAQNIAAQSGILIESATFTTGSSSVDVTIRNVGKVTVTLGRYYITQTSGGTTSSNSDSFSSSDTVEPGSATTKTLTLPSSASSGDIITIKVTTKAGTFAQATYIVP